MEPPGAGPDSLCGLQGPPLDGENTWFYFLWYGLGRAWIEGLRTDSLYLFDWTLFGQPIRVSQALSLVMAAVAAAMLFYQIRIKKRSAEDLLVNRLARQQAGMEAKPSTDMSSPTDLTSRKPRASSRPSTA